jgi:hypothetical protein
VRKLTYHWIIRADDHFSWFKNDLQQLVEVARRTPLQLQIVVHVTQSLPPSLTSGFPHLGKAADANIVAAVDSNSQNASSAGSIASLGDEKTPLSGRTNAAQWATPTLSMKHNGRPSVESLIRPTVEAALGETAVVVCGGVSITAQTRTFVATLSDERAVHKGSGAQGIYLFSETYGW